jgi:DNA-binding PadR family transcriptional regulator
MRGVRFGRFGETAVWILVALRAEPHTVVRLLDEVRHLDGQIGPGTLFAALARLERAALVEQAPTAKNPGAYRVTARQAASAVTTDGGTTR